MNTPLIGPIESEREGYVLNVVYSCGSILHKENLVIFFAVFDSSCRFARIPLEIKKYSKNPILIKEMVPLM